MKTTTIKLLAVAGLGAACVGAVAPAVAQERFYYRHDIGRLDQMRDRLADLQAQYDAEVNSGQYYAARRTQARIHWLQRRIGQMERFGHYYYRP